MLNTVSRFMTIPMSATMKRIPLKDVKGLRTATKPLETREHLFLANAVKKRQTS